VADAEERQVAAIILAAGKSTRMKSDVPKVLHEVCGRPMLGHAISAARLAGVDQIIVVIGHGRERVTQAFETQHDVTWVEQTEQRGTGHAVQCCREALSGFDGSVVVIAGDMPLIRRQAIIELVDVREDTGHAATIATTKLTDPTGYGRIVRDDDGNLVAIVEDRDCSDQQRAITEVNPSYYCFDAKKMFDVLDKIEPAASKGEYYLTDAIRLLRESDEGVSAKLEIAAEDAMGVNSRFDLAAVNRAMQDRIQATLVEAGVTVIDPDNTWIEADVTVGRDTTIFPFTFVGRGATIGSECKIGPFAHVAAAETIGDGTELGGSSIVGVVGAVGTERR
jgi:bifunctional UDP-N-acetylglucosamine pyrophosphorylase / glucosamine-1-phosphate N-acetyltransferase